MTLIDDETLNLKRPAAITNEFKIEIWKRCEVVSFLYYSGARVSEDSDPVVRSQLANSGTG